MSDAPRTEAESAQVTKALDGLVDAAGEMGVTIGDEDKAFTYPTVVTRPLAIFR